MRQPSSLPDPRLAGRFLFLDALRGIAAVAIALFHFNNQYFSPTWREFSALLPAPVLAVWRHMDIGVEIFFVISGFVIAHSLWGRPVNARFVGNFIVRFVIRLSPTYWVVLGLTMLWPYLVFPSLVVGFFDQFGGWTGLFINAAYLADFTGHPRIVPVAWTLFLEVQFYLVTIATLWLSSAVAPRSRMVGRLVLAVPFGLLGVLSYVQWLRYGSFDFAGHWWTFASGTITYATLRERWRPIAVPAMIVALAAATILRGDLRSGMTAATCAAIYIVALLGHLQTALSWRPLQYLGRISYSLFLVHIPVGIGVIATVQHFGDKSATATITGVWAALLVSILVADALYRLVELPSARVSQKLRKRHPERSEGTGRSPPFDPPGPSLRSG